MSATNNPFALDNFTQNKYIIQYNHEFKNNLILHASNGILVCFFQHQIAVNTVNSRYLEVVVTIFYKFKLPEVQINLHFG